MKIEQQITFPTQSQPPRRREKRARSILLPGPPIAGYLIQRDEENHYLAINQRTVRCTADEYRLLMQLLERYERPVPFDELIAQFRDGSSNDLAFLSLARRKLTCMLSALRAKLEATDFTITRVVDVGYMLIHRDRLWSTAHPTPAEKDERW